MRLFILIGTNLSFCPLKILIVLSIGKVCNIKFLDDLFCAKILDYPLVT